MHERMRRNTMIRLRVLSEDAIYTLLENDHWKKNICIFQKIQYTSRSRLHSLSNRLENRLENLFPFKQSGEHAQFNGSHMDKQRSTKNTRIRLRLHDVRMPRSAFWLLIRNKIPFR